MLVDGADETVGKKLVEENAKTRFDSKLIMTRYWSETHQVCRHNRTYVAELKTTGAMRRAVSA